MMAARTLRSPPRCCSPTSPGGSAATRPSPSCGAAWRHCLVLGVLNAALPFWLIAWGEKHIDSGLAAVVQASVPIFNALLVLSFLPHERLSAARARRARRRHPRRRASSPASTPSGGWWAVAGALAVVLSSLSYASGGVYGQRAVSGTRRARCSPPARCSSAALILLPLALFQLPAERPAGRRSARCSPRARSARRLRSSSSSAMLALHGSARLSLVTYLMPGFALVYGALILDEAITRRDARRARPDPGRRRARLGRRAAAAARGRDSRGRERLDPPRAAGRRRLPRRALRATRTSRPFLAAAGAYERDGLAEHRRAPR